MTGRKPLALLLLLLLLLTLCCSAALADSVNLLTNPSFEELDADGYPTGWSPEAYYTAEGYTLFAS